MSYDGRRYLHAEGRRTYVLFGTRIMTSQTVKTYFIEDGPHIEKWEALLRQMEADGVTMLSDD